MQESDLPFPSELKPTESLGLVPTNGKNLSYGYSPDVVARALAHCMSTKSVALAWRQLRDEMEASGESPIPTYRSLWYWVKEDEECFQAVAGANKREMVAISEDAVRVWGERMIEAAETPNLKPTETGINYGISQQRRTEWDRVQGSPLVAVQVNFKDSKGKEIEDF